MNTWYRWAQEIFCDAVGFEIGCPCFVNALAEYIAELHSTDFHRSEDHLRGTTHPITALRIELLISRARARGYDHVASEVEDQWTTLATALSKSNDYHGYYVNSLLEPLARTVEDMLTEAAPRAHRGADVQEGKWDPSIDGPVKLFNAAWAVYRKDPTSYDSWEKAHTPLFIAGDADGSMADTAGGGDVASEQPQTVPVTG